MARRRGDLLAPANGAQFEELESSFRGFAEIRRDRDPATVQGFDAPSDPTPTLPTSPAAAVDGTRWARRRRRRRIRVRSARSHASASAPGVAGTSPSLAAADVMIGALAASVPTLFSNSLGHQLTVVATLALIGAIVWPLAIGLARGYVKSRVGVGSDELARGPAGRCRRRRRRRLSGWSPRQQTLLDPRRRWRPLRRAAQHGHPIRRSQGLAPPPGQGPERPPRRRRRFRRSGPRAARPARGQKPTAA